MLASTLLEDNSDASRAYRPSFTEALCQELVVSRTRTLVDQCLADLKGWREAVQGAWASAVPATCLEP